MEGRGGSVFGAGRRVGIRPKKRATWRNSTGTRVHVRTSASPPGSSSSRRGSTSPLNVVVDAAPLVGVARADLPTRGTTSKRLFKNEVTDTTGRRHIGIHNLIILNSPLAPSRTTPAAPSFRRRLLHGWGGPPCRRPRRRPPGPPPPSSASIIIGRSPLSLSCVLGLGEGGCGLNRC